MIPRAVLGGALVIGLVAAALFPTPADAGGSNLVARAAVKRLMERDVARDALTAAKPLARDTTVWRYASRKQAAHEARNGFHPGTHFTTKVHPGRPPSAAKAQRRYGLPARPQVRETVRLTKGTPMRHNKAYGGGPGRGELTNQLPLSNGAQIGTKALR